MIEDCTQDDKSNNSVEVVSGKKLLKVDPLLALNSGKKVRKIKKLVQKPETGESGINLPLPKFDASNVKDANITRDGVHYQIESMPISFNNPQLS